MGADGSCRVAGRTSPALTRGRTPSPCTCLPPSIILLGSSSDDLLFVAASARGVPARPTSADSRTRAGTIRYLFLSLSQRVELTAACVAVSARAGSLERSRTSPAYSSPSLRAGNTARTGSGSSDSRLTAPARRPSPRVPTSPLAAYVRILTDCCCSFLRRGTS
jgi:hypothetical protein